MKIATREEYPKLIETRDRIIKGIESYTGENFGKTPQIAIMDEYDYFQYVAEEAYKLPIPYTKDEMAEQISTTAQSLYLFSLHFSTKRWQVMISDMIMDSFNLNSLTFGIAHELVHGYQDSINKENSFICIKGQTEDFIRMIVEEGHADYLAKQVVKRDEKLFGMAKKYIDSYFEKIQNTKTTKQFKEYREKVVNGCFHTKTNFDYKYVLGEIYMEKAEARWGDHKLALQNIPKKIEEILI